MKFPQLIIILLSIMSASATVAQTTEPQNQPQQIQDSSQVKQGDEQKRISFFSKTFPKRKGRIGLVLSLPHVNSFFMQPDKEGEKIKTGFWGITTGLEYFYKDNQYVSLKISAVSDISVPVPAAVDIEGVHESMGSVYGSLTNNHILKRFHLGYGLSYGKNSWRLEDYGSFDDPSPPAFEPIRKSSQFIGLMFHTYYHITRSFLFGVVYRPSFIRVTPQTELAYEHLISVDFGWRIGLKK